MKKGAEDWDNIFGVDWGHTAPLEIAGSPPQCVGQWVSGDGENDDGEGESGGGFGGHTQPAVVHSPHNSAWGRREVGWVRTVLHELRLVCNVPMPLPIQVPHAACMHAPSCMYREPLGLSSRY